MAIVTATEVTSFTDISTGATAISNLGIIPIVQERINYITNNFFLSDMYLAGTVTFTSAAGTIVSTQDFADEGFLAGDEIYIYNSYRNDGYKIIGSVTTTTITVSSSDSVIAEPSGRSVLIAVVKWPNALKYIAAQMVKFDYDDRPAQEVGVSSKSLGPYSVSYASRAQVGGTPFGYPQELIDSLASWTMARVN